MYCSSIQCWQNSPCLLHEPKSMVFFIFYPNNSKPLVCALEYDELDEVTKREFESMSLAGSFLQIEDSKLNDYASGFFFEEKEYPILHRTFQYWKKMAQFKGSIYEHSASPEQLFHQLSTLKYLKFTNEENILVQHCILLSEQLHYEKYRAHFSLRVWWSKVDKVSKPFKIVNCDADDIKTVLLIAFGIKNPQLSSANYGFISIDQRQYNLLNNKELVIQLEDRTLGFYFHE